MGVPTAFLDALEQSGMSMDMIPTAPLRFNPLVITVTGVPSYNKEAQMGTFNSIDVKAEVAEATGGTRTNRVRLTQDEQEIHGVKFVQIERVMRSTFTKALIEALEAADEQAADEVFLRLRHKDTLKAHNRARLQKAFDAFQAQVPEWVDPITIAVAEAAAAKAEAEREAADEVPATPAPVAVPVADEAAELRSQVWQLTVTVAALAKAMGVEVDA